MVKKSKKKVAKKTAKKTAKKVVKASSKRGVVSGKGCRKKGLDFERWVANSIGHIFPDAQRRLEYQASNVNGCDLDNTGSYGIQCKCRQTYASVGTIKEVICPSDVIPVLVTKANNAPPVVVMYFNDWVNMLEQIKTNVLNNETLGIEKCVEGLMPMLTNKCPTLPDLKTEIQIPLDMGTSIGDVLMGSRELKINPPMVADTNCKIDKTIKAGKVYMEDPILICPPEDFI